VNYRKSANPYEARYGKDWMEHIKAATQLKPYTDVRDLIVHIAECTKKAGKKHFYHDALSLMTAKESIQFMKEKGYLDMWIRPQQNLFADQKGMNSYRGRPPGNSAELMPLDTTLNKDVHESVNCHVIFTNDLEKDHPGKFGMATPKEASESYNRIFHPETGVAPTPARILQDIDKVFVSIKKIVKCQGTVLEDTNSAISGHRREKRPEHRKDMHGGPRKRLRADDDYGCGRYVIHKDALEACDLRVEAAKDLFYNIKKEMKEEFIDSKICMMNVSDDIAEADGKEG